MTSATKRLLAVLLLILVGVGGIAVWKSRHANDFPVPDEKAVALEALSEKLSGSKFFNVPAGAAPASDGPWIDFEECERQVDRVVRERQWNGTQRERLKLLISQLAEPKPARMVGGDRLQLVRLNLALDEL